MITMAIKENKDLIISLIKDLLLFTKLTNGLARIGWEADEYHLHLPETIFTLMHFKDNKQTEKVFEDFVKYLTLVDNIDIKYSQHKVEELAHFIYTQLKQHT